jgi:LacI family transcriptional regulator
MRNHPAIPKATCERVQEVARRLGYTPDPALSALIAHRAAKSVPRFRSALAWLTSFPTADGWRQNPHFIAYFNGARARAESLGYTLDEIWYEEPGRKKDLSAMLLARGIRGILVPPLPAPHSHLRLDWAQFAAVAFGSTLTRPPLTTVAHNHFRSTIKLTRHLLSIGFKKPRLYVTREVNERVDGIWTSGFRSVMEASGLATAGVFRYLPDSRPESFMAMIKKDRPDVILAPFWRHALAAVEMAGMRVPDDLSVAVMTVPHTNPTLGGVTENGEVMGAVAVEHLTGLLQRGDYGLPRRPLRILIEGDYVAGQTIRRPGARGSDASSNNTNAGKVAR